MKKRTFREFIVEIMIPMAIYIGVMPMLAPDIWDHVAGEPWYVIITMHILSIMMCVCWIEAYNCILNGILKRPKRPKT